MTLAPAARGILVLLLAGVLTGCSLSMPSLQDRLALPPSLSSETTSLLVYANTLGSWPRNRVRAELARLEKARCPESPDSPDCLRLAMLLGLTGAPERDDARARTLLTSYLAARPAGAEPDGERELAALLLATLDDRRRQTRELRNAEAALARERSERRTLQQQLDQLKAIEESINRRANPAEGDKRP